MADGLFARGAAELGPPRAMEEAVAEAYEPRLRCCFDDDDLPLPRLPFALPAEDEGAAARSSDSLPLEKEKEALPEPAESPLRILFMLPVFILILS